jgi:hypothetical protein
LGLISGGYFLFEYLIGINLTMLHHLLNLQK